ncbi:hypothetical protein BRARA_E02023 [Brassica rapa]|uniref:BnaA05g36170D protein n=3 Tax=Brassica TaxID=3705 RepID=A0A078J4H0_BRANA|nr:uncharacterized protein LOC103831539 [Brassica rapa]XP_009105669.1 uncharacterized protein LOC103831539 [Brassica rapa]XP_048632560.1 protein IQ-DOMAIN 9-like [Brassica napus]XP_048632561.1 protein IQ-DOMAIN 9-like [Brassica napus]KAH0849687.1 hypothetical protein HID58_091337 [Brassica napus]KAH0916116.1 hypothetical protein HID58_030562 [Brassica napus]KAH0926701.1 hypothetical protein HID58_018957 [Brassica napus]KAH0934620.1 hypothetical protein HID58_011737 [Brassica napus]RID62990.
MGSENFFKAIIGSKKGKQTKGLSTAIKSKTSKKKGTHASSLVVCSEDWAATRIQTVFFLVLFFLVPVVRCLHHGSGLPLSFLEPLFFMMLEMWFLAGEGS